MRQGLSLKSQGGQKAPSGALEPGPKEQAHSGKQEKPSWVMGEGAARLCSRVPAPQAREAGPLFWKDGVFTLFGFPLNMFLLLLQTKPDFCKRCQTDSTCDASDHKKKGICADQIFKAR